VECYAPLWDDPQFLKWIRQNYCHIWVGVCLLLKEDFCQGVNYIPHPLISWRTNIYWRSKWTVSLQKNQCAVLLLASTFIPEVGNCLSTMFIPYFPEHCAVVYLALVDFYSVVDTSRIFYFGFLDLNLHLETHCANCHCCILCYTYHAHSYIHCVSQQVCSLKYKS